MSAFIVAAATIDAAVSAIFDHLSSPRWNQIQYGPVTIGPVTVTNRDDLQKLATALYEMNHAAVDVRYSEKNPRPLYRFKYITGIAPVFGVKQLSCLLYQCSEGDVPDSPLFKAVQKLENEICSAIVTRSRDYDAAPWGCDEEHVNRRVVSLFDMATGRA